MFVINKTKKKARKLNYKINFIFKIKYQRQETSIKVIYFFRRVNDYK